MKKIDKIICRDCKDNCKRGFRTGLFCQFIKDDNTYLAASIIDSFLSNILPTDLGIYYEMLKIFASNRFDFDKNLKNKNVRNMIRVLAELELFRKISISVNDTNYHYANAKSYYKRLFGLAEEDEHVIKLIEGDRIEYI